MEASFPLSQGLIMDTLEILWQLDTMGRAMQYLNTSNTEPFRLQNFIGNQFLDSAHTSEWIDSPDPRSGDLLLKVPRSPANVVEYAINVAHRAFTAWSQTPFQVRGLILLRIASIMEDKKDMFAIWESIDQGKAIGRAQLEVDYAIEHFRFFATYIMHDESAVRLHKGAAEQTFMHKQRVPVGVCAIVVSSDMPLYLLTLKIAPCLAFGCTGVAKPSERTSMTAFLLAEVLRQTELPAGVMNIIFGDGPGTGSTLIRSRRIQGVSFTGGTETRIQIRKDTAADIVKHLCLDIRGSSPTLVFGDVEIEQGASAAAYAAFENSGQLCRSGSVIYVHRSIYNLFLHKLKTHVQDKYRLHLELGPVVSKERYAKIRSLLIQAREENAMFVTGEIPKEVPKNGFWVSPTVLSNVRTNSRLAREGILGPVAVVCPFDDEEAVRLCNDNPNAVGAVVLTDDLRRMRRVIGHLNAGLMWANCCLGREFGAGFNDIRATGLGREGGERSRDEFTKLQIMHFPAY
ncbi:hypothetical protein N7530_011146 [Penicillium desertorum]|uniref:Aldehyde dehydrogenase domain-containing protein n=1 Tax=Penicillium desertorum TaxID=1303715 RepID=A0A9X0BH97_9EURO|nr:hypothetical protein N7530_011146 [Penicillium desertorum]